MNVATVIECCYKTVLKTVSKKVAHKAAEVTGKFIELLSESKLEALSYR